MAAIEIASDLWRPYFPSHYLSLKLNDIRLQNTYQQQCVYKYMHPKDRVDVKGI